MIKRRGRREAACSLSRLDRQHTQEALLTLWLHERQHTYIHTYEFEHMLDVRKQETAHTHTHTHTHLLVIAINQTSTYKFEAIDIHYKACI